MLIALFLLILSYFSILYWLGSPTKYLVPDQPFLLTVLIYFLIMVIGSAVLSLYMKFILFILRIKLPFQDLAKKGLISSIFLLIVIFLTDTFSPNIVNYLTSISVLNITIYDLLSTVVYYFVFAYLLRNLFKKTVLGITTTLLLSILLFYTPQILFYFLEI